MRVLLADQILWPDSNGLGVWRKILRVLFQQCVVAAVCDELLKISGPERSHIN